jgi:hypothetical protein
MLGEVQDATKHTREEASGDAAGTDQSSGGTPEDKAGGDQAGAPVSDANAKGAGRAPQSVSAEEHAKVRAEYEKLFQVVKEKETRERRQRDDALRKQGEFEKLYNTDHTELEALRPRLERMSATVQALLDAELQGLPKDFDKSLLPAGDPDTQLAWLTKAKRAGLLTGEKAATKAGDGTPPQRGAASEGFASIYKKQQ